MTSNLPNLSLLEQAVTKVDSLTDAVTALTVLFAEEKQYAQKQRRKDWIVILIFLVLVSLGLFGFYHTTVQINNVKTSARISCQTSNETRDTQRQLWTDLLTRPQTPGMQKPSPEFLTAFNKLLDVSFSPRNCE